MDKKTVLELEDAVKTLKVWMNQSAAMVTPEIRDAALELFQLGKCDLAVSKLAFDGGHYPQALSLLQQSVEKLGKSGFLVTGQEKPEKLATHYFYEPVSKKILDTNATAFDYFTEVSKIDLPFSSDFSEIRRNEVKLREMSKEKINEFFNSFDEGVAQVMDDGFIATELNRQFGFYEGKIDVHHLNVARKSAKEQTPRVRNMLLSVLNWAKLTSLVVLLTSHYQSSRYPYDNKGASYSDDYHIKYVQNLGVIQAYPLVYIQIQNLFTFFGDSYGLELKQVTDD
ncbi:MAG: hypothetical protein Q8P05_06110 [Candidatus Diapherotrites archaeon]|nr:hypothetical protein [Candidatus Diapherotrites archaeon]